MVSLWPPKQQTNFCLVIDEPGEVSAYQATLPPGVWTISLKVIPVRSSFTPHIWSLAETCVIEKRSLLVLI